MDTSGHNADVSLPGKFSQSIKACFNGKGQSYVLQSILKNTLGSEKNHNFENSVNTKLGFRKELNFLPLLKI